MKATYKFLNSGDIDRVLVDGTIRVSTLSYFRELETKDQWIGDKQEGVVTVNINDTIITEENNHRFHPPGIPPGIRVGGTVHAVVKSARLRYGIHGPFIFCASHGELGPLTKTMCHDAKEPYDACVRINNMEQLAHRIFHRGFVVETNQRVRELFGAYECSLVTYDDVIRDEHATSIPSPSPFLKGNGFAPQCEIRIVLTPILNTVIHLKRLTIRIPKPRDIFAKVFRDLARESLPEGLHETVPAKSPG